MAVERYEGERGKADTLPLGKVCWCLVLSRECFM